LRKRNCEKRGDYTVKLAMKKKGFGNLFRSGGHSRFWQDFGKILARFWQDFGKILAGFGRRKYVR
jgi:hypothetical protein